MSASSPTPGTSPWPILERYQRYLYHYRKPNGAPLTFGTQQTFLAPLKAFFQWATRERHLLYNPASELLLPRLPRRLPKHILSVADVEALIQQPDVTTPSGLRDRAMLETLYSSGIRRMELTQLKLYDVDTRGGSLTVRGGKGGRDRVVPLGARACAWVDRYLEEVRPQLLARHDDGSCFLTDFGEPFEKNRLGDLVKGYIERAGFKVDRLLPPVPPRDGHPHAGERRRHPLHPGDPRPQRPGHHGDLHPGLDPQAERSPRGDSPREGPALKTPHPPDGGLGGHKNITRDYAHPWSPAAAVSDARGSPPAPRVSAAQGGRIICAMFKCPPACADAGSAGRAREKVRPAGRVL